MYHASVPLGLHDVSDCKFLCTITLHPGGAHGWALKFYFPQKISYADLDGSLMFAIWSMLRESSQSRSWSNRYMGKFGSVEHRALMKWFLKVLIGILQYQLYVLLVEQIDNCSIHGKRIFQLCLMPHCPIHKIVASVVVFKHLADGLEGVGNCRCLSVWHWANNDDNGVVFICNKIYLLSL